MKVESGRAEKKLQALPEVTTLCSQMVPGSSEGPLFVQDPSGNAHTYLLQSSFLQSRTAPELNSGEDGVTAPGVSQRPRCGVLIGPAISYCLPGWTQTPKRGKTMVMKRKPRARSSFLVSSREEKKTAYGYHLSFSLAPGARALFSKHFNSPSTIKLGHSFFLEFTMIKLIIRNVQKPKNKTKQNKKTPKPPYLGPRQLSIANRFEPCYAKF